MAGALSSSSKSRASLKSERDTALAVCRAVMPRQVADGRRIAKRTQCLTFTIFTRVKQKVEMRFEHFFLSLPFQTPDVYYEKKKFIKF